MSESSIFPFLKSIGSDPQLTPLDSEHDRNSLVQFSNRNPIVVKLMKIEKYESSIDLIVECMTLSGHIDLVTCHPLIVDDHFLVAYEYIETGQILSTLTSPLSPSLVYQIGAAVGTLDTRLVTCSHCKPRSNLLEWHFSNFPTLVKSNLQYVSRSQSIIKKIASLFSSIPFGQLPYQICHNDCNDDNIIVSEKKVVIIDYCDVDYVPRISDIAILCTYLIGMYLRNGGDGDRMVEDVMKPALAGFLATNNSLTPFEISFIPLLTLSRAAMSILIQSKNMELYPDNAVYLGCSMESNNKFLNLVELIGINNFLNSF